MPLPPIVFVTGRYQFGNNPGLFQDALYIGHELTLPFRKTWLDDGAASFGVNVYTHDIATWGQWLGHRLSINDVEIGRLKDPDDRQGTTEVFRLAVPRSTIEAALGGNDTFTLAIELDVQPARQGLSDDFVLTRIESDGTFAASLGW